MSMSSTILKVNHNGPPPEDRMVIGRSTPKSVPSRELVGTKSAKRWTELPSLDRGQKALPPHFIKQVEQRHLERVRSGRSGVDSEWWTKHGSALEVKKQRGPIRYELSEGNPEG